VAGLAGRRLRRGAVLGLAACAASSVVGRAADERLRRIIARANVA
jgi:hypothetical protein